MKECRKCKQEKELNNFGIDKKQCDGLNGVCKQCRQSFSKEHSKRLYEKNKLWKENNVDKIKEYQKEYSKVWNQNNVNKRKEYSKEYYAKNNVDKIKDSNKKYNENNVNKRKEYYDNNVEKLKIKRKEYYKNNKEATLLTNNAYRNKRKESDPLYKLSVSLRSMISTTIKKNGYKKLSKTELILGCSFDFLKQYLESHFEHWMSWDNYGLYNGELNYGWDIDHIIPCASALNEEELLKLNHYSNLRPLCSKINRDIKRDKII
jgi:hypothetical protein